MVDGAQRETGKQQPNDINKLGANAEVNKGQIDLESINKNGPYFDKAASKNVTALLGKTVYLTCRVKNLGNKTVSIVEFLFIFIFSDLFYKKNRCRSKL